MTLAKTSDTADLLADLSRWGPVNTANLRPAVRCSAWKTDGSRQCLAYAIHGGTVCWHHGGAARQVRLAAQLRLYQAAAERAVARQAAKVARRREREIAHAAKVLGCEPHEVTSSGRFLAGALEQWDRLMREDGRGVTRDAPQAGRGRPGTSGA